MLHGAREIIADTYEPLKKLQRIEEFTNQPVQLFLGEFSRFLADRITSSTLTPDDFIFDARLALYDLSMGKSGFTDEPIRNRLVGHTSEFYITLANNIPGMARVAFPEDFADAVATEWLKSVTRSNQNKQDDPAITEDTTDSDIIKDIIDNIVDAKEQIFGDARSRVSSLDWAHFQIGKDEVEKWCEVASPLILRNADMNFSFNVLRTDNAAEVAMLAKLDWEHKMQLESKSYLVLLNQELSQDEVTFIRDWLWLKIPETIIAVHNLPAREVRRHFMVQNNDLERAIFRLKRGLIKRGKLPDTF